MIVKKILLLYILLVSIFTMLLIIVFAIPTSSINKNIIESVKQIQKEGLWFKPLGFYLFQIDNMTDCLMMNINASAKSDNPLYSSMIIEYSQPYSRQDTKTYKNMDQTTLDIAVNGINDSTVFSEYSRYWHGYQVILRPLLYFFNYNQIRILNYITFFLLLTITIFLMYKKLSILYAITFTATLILSNIFIVPLALQFSTCFYIALLGMATLLKRNKMVYNDNKITVLFFILGAFTSYIDFLTTPIITLGFPLTVLIAIKNEHEKIKEIIKQCSVWFIGYASIWSSKWLIGWALTGNNIIYSAMGCAQQRIGSSIVFLGKEMPMSDFFGLITTKISSAIHPLWIVILLLLITIATFLYFYKNKKKLKTHYWLIIIAFMPMMWFIIMKNHSLQHIFFTWRDFILTLWCLLIFVFSKNNQLKKNENSRSHTLLQ